MSWILSSLAVGYVGWCLWQAQAWRATGGLLLEMSGRPSAWLALLFLLANLGLEARKWQGLMRSVGLPLGPGLAWRGILQGAALGLFTPNRMGDYAGRLMQVSAPTYPQAAVATLASRMAQMCITLLLGAVALSAMGAELDGWWPWEEKRKALQGLVWALALLGAGAYLWPQALLRLIGRLRLPGTWVQKLLDAFQALSPRVLRRTWGLSLLRGTVFALQFAWLCLAASPGLPWGEALALCSLVLLFKSLLPAMALAELGLRESVALLVMGSQGWAAPAVVAATFALYLINLVLPALLGWASLLGARRT
jgi:hypothetical protein